MDRRDHARRGRLGLAVAVGLALTLLAAACGGDSGTSSSGSTDTTAARPAATGPAPTGPGTPAPQPLPQRTPVATSIVVDGVEAYSQLLLAKAMGEFEKENLDVTISKVPTPESVALLGQGKLDVAPLGANIGVLNAVDQGVDLALVAAMPGFPDNTKNGFWMRSELVPADGKVDPCQLKGLRTVLGGSSGFGSTAVLTYANLIEGCPDFKVTDIQLSTLSGPELLIALENDAVDVAYLPDPLWADPDAKGYAKLIAPYVGATGNGWAMGTIRHERPEVAEAIIRAMVRTTRTYLQGDYRKDPVVRAKLIEVLGVPANIFDQGVSLVFDPDMRFQPEVAEQLQEIWLDVGGLLAFEEAVPISDVLDNAPLDRVLAG